MPGNNIPNHNNDDLTVLKFTDSNTCITVNHANNQKEIEELYILGSSDKILVYVLEKKSTVQLENCLSFNTDLNSIVKKYKVEPDKIFISGNLL